MGLSYSNNLEIPSGPWSPSFFRFPCLIIPVRAPFHCNFRTFIPHCFLPLAPPPFQCIQYIAIMAVSPPCWVTLVDRQISFSLIPLISALLPPPRSPTGFVNLPPPPLIINFALKTIFRCFEIRLGTPPPPARKDLPLPQIFFVCPFSFRRVLFPDSSHRFPL